MPSRYGICWLVSSLINSPHQNTQHTGGEMFEQLSSNFRTSERQSMRSIVGKNQIATIQHSHESAASNSLSFIDTSKQKRVREEIESGGIPLVNT